MKTKINNKLIRSFNPCYDPEEIEIPNAETITIKKWVEKYRGTVKNKADIIWLLTRKEFMSDRDIRLFAVWCAREALKLIDNPDPRSINACDVSEKFANNEATNEELTAARDAVGAAVGAAARDAAWAAAWAAAWDAAGDAARDAAWDAAWDAQINQLMTYFK